MASTPLPSLRATVPGGCAAGTVALSDRSLDKVNHTVAVPSYDRGALTPSVVHLSVGGFARSHQLMYFDELAQRRFSMGWGVVGVGLHNPEMRDALAPQDYLYMVVERDAHGARARVIGSMVDYVFAPEDPEAVLARLTDARTRLVTLTITGTGYRINPQTGEFDADDAEVRADLRHPHRPGGALGFLVEALARRRRNGTAPFTVLACDNMRNNGRAARTAVVGFARLRDEVLARWIGDNVAFPSSMVDRITPRTSPGDRAAIASAFGVDDRWPVITEPFCQWIVEDRFCNDRPPLDHVGVRFVPDVAPYELMKTRLLNASHSALGYLGLLAGHRHTHEAVADPVFHRYLDRLMAEEVVPQLPPIGGIDLADYRRNLLTRFANPAIADRLERLCERGSTKMPNYLLPSLHQALAEDRPRALLVLAVAGWMRFLRGTDEAGDPVDIVDPHRRELHELAVTGHTDPRPLLTVNSVFGELGQNPNLVEELARALHRLERDGVRATLAADLDATVPGGVFPADVRGESA